MALDPAAVRLINAYTDQTAEIRRQVVAYIQRVWGSLDAYRDADIDRFVQAVVPVVTGGQLRTAQLTDGYLAGIQAAALGTPARPYGIPADLVTDEAIRGVSAEAVYQRAGVTVWTALSRGADLAEAADRGLNRAIGMASTDLQLAKTHAARNVLSRNSRVIGYRRVLGGGNNCQLCTIAATQRYTSDNLMPIHTNCSCGIEPIYGSNDPGPSVDPDTVTEDDLIVHSHGEIGPTLAVRGQSFTGPDDI